MKICLKPKSIPAEVPSLRSLPNGTVFKVASGEVCMKICGPRPTIIDLSNCEVYSNGNWDYFYKPVEIFLDACLNLYGESK